MMIVNGSFHLSSIRGTVSEHLAGTTGKLRISFGPGYNSNHFGMSRSLKIDVKLNDCEPMRTTK